MTPDQIVLARALSPHRRVARPALPDATRMSAGALDAIADEPARCDRCGLSVPTLLRAQAEAAADELDRRSQR